MTAQILFHQLVYLDRLKKGGFTDEQARASAEALETALSEAVATKSDIAELKTELKAFSAQVDTKIANVQTEIQKSQNRILLTIITVAFAMIGVLKYLP